MTTQPHHFRGSGHQAAFLFKITRQRIVPIASAVLVGVCLSSCSVTNDSLWPSITPAQPPSRSARAGGPPAQAPATPAGTSLLPANIWDVAGGVALLVGFGGALALLWRLPVMNRRFDNLRSTYETLAQRRDKGATDLVELSMKVSVLNQQLQSLQGELSRRPTESPEIPVASANGLAASAPAPQPAPPQVAKVAEPAVPQVAPKPIPLAGAPGQGVASAGSSNGSATNGLTGNAISSNGHAGNGYAGNGSAGQASAGNGRVIPGPAPAPAPAAQGSALASDRVPVDSRAFWSEGLPGAGHSASGRSPQAVPAAPLPPSPPPQRQSPASAARSAAGGGEITLADLVLAINGESEKPVVGISFVELDFAEPPDLSLQHPGLPPPTRLRRVGGSGSFLLVILDGDDWLFPAVSTLQAADAELAQRGLFQLCPAAVAAPRLRMPAQMREVGGLWEVTECGQIEIPS
jgi:hypothetical protein